MNQLITTFPKHSRLWIPSGTGDTGRFLWVYKDNPRLRISSETENVFGYSHWIYPAITRNKPSRHPYGLTLRLGKVEKEKDYIPADLSISVELGYIAVVADPNYFSAIMPIDKGKWLIIVLYPSN